MILAVFLEKKNFGYKQSLRKSHKKEHVLSLAAVNKSYKLKGVCLFKWIIESLITVYKKKLDSINKRHFTKTDSAMHPGS